MRTDVFELGGVIARITYPDERVMAFNTNRIDFEVSGAKYVDVACNGQRITIQVYRGKARADISRLLQLGFDDPRNVRVRNVRVEYFFNGSFYYSKSFDVQVIWGAVSVGERLNTIGSYKFDGNTFVRHVRWFYNMPQKLCVYNGTDFELFTPTRTHYTYGIHDTTAVNDLVWDDTFDDTFKHQFRWEENGAAEIYLTKDRHKCGLFLRWIDNIGLMQYFSFADKAEVDGVEIESTVNVGFSAFGIHHNGEQDNKRRTRSVTCAAINVTRNEMDYVRTIVTSPIVDMYCGSDADGEIWMPVKVEAREYAIDTRKEMQDFEINVIIPTSDVQSV